MTYKFTKPSDPSENFEVIADSSLDLTGFITAMSEQGFQLELL
jgi:hypothetical protein